MSDEIKLWRVTLRREAEVFVVAPDRGAAERIALDEGIDEVDESDVTVDYATETKVAHGEDRDARPYGTHDDDERTVGDILDGRPIPPTREQIEAAWLAQPAPTTLAALIEWLRMAPTESWRRDPWIGPLGATGAYVTDGRGLLAIDVVDAQPPEPTGSPTSKSIATLIERDTAGASWMRQYDLAQLDEWSAHGIGTIEGVALDGRLVQRWALAAARITGGTITVRGGVETSATVWSGPGWTALVMPTLDERNAKPIESFASPVPT